MALFRCLKSKDTTNYITGVDLGTSTTTKYTLVNTPIVAGSLSGTIHVGIIPVQTFSVSVLGVFTFASIGSPSAIATAGSLNLGTGVITLTWNIAPGTNSAITSYTGLPVFKFVTSKIFGVSCPKVNTLCNIYSKAYVSAVTVCDQSL